MSFWRFSRSSRGPRPHATPLSPNQLPSDEGPNHDPPRYSDLNPAAVSLAPPPHASETPPAEANDAQYRATSRRSVVSLGSQVSTPSYATYDDDAFSISSVTTAQTAPPQYSSWSQVALALRGGQQAGNSASIPEHTFDIRGNFKSEPWAILRLYDAGPRSSHDPRTGKYPRFSSLDVILGNVELRLTSPQTIRSIELTLKGSIVTGSLGEGGSTTFLEQGYNLWDRKFGEPHLLVHNQAQPARGSSKYDGKLSGNWLFPFSIPFPTRVDLSTRRAIHPETGEGPVRFLPECLTSETHVTPFNDGGDPTRIPAAQGSTITPFDVRAPHVLTEKGRLVSSEIDAPAQATAPQFAALGLLVAPAPGSPSLEPYALPPTPSHPTSPVFQYDTKRDHSSPHQVATIERGQGSEWSSMQGSWQSATSTATGHPLPQSLLERSVLANIRYELILTVTHGMFPKKSRVSTLVTYLPVTVPRPISPGREGAYRRKEMPPGPDVNPAGWKQLPPVSIKGTFSDQKTLVVHYGLSLALPLSYARGTVLPCCLTVACDETSALNLFANPRTPRVRLRRSTRFLRNHAEHAKQDSPVVGLTSDPNLWGGSTNPTLLRPKISGNPLELTRRSRASRLSPQPPKQGHDDITPFLPGVLEEEEEKDTLTPSDELETEQQEVGDGAVWCTPTHFTQESNVRNLYGEIHLPKGLQPTCKFPLFNILYHVDLLAPATNAFVPDVHHKLEPSARTGKAAFTGLEKIEGTNRVYASHFVEITTARRKGEPLPIAFVGQGA